MDNSLLEALRWVWPFIVAIAMIAVADRLRRPSLKIEFRPEPISADSRRWVHVYVYNKPLKLIARNHATECKGRVTYINLETNQRKGPIYVSWASTPTPETIRFDASGKPIDYSIAETAVQARYIETLVPGSEPNPLDIAVKFDGQTDAWIWTPESYKRYRRDEYQLAEGTYRVEVGIESPGIDPVEGNFILENKGDKAAGLRLAPAPRTS